MDSELRCIPYDSLGRGYVKGIGGRLVLTPRMEWGGGCLSGLLGNFCFTVKSWPMSVAASLGGALGVPDLLGEVRPGRGKMGAN